MRKNILAKSIAIMIGGFGLVGGAHAVVDADPTPPVGVAVATALEVNTDGIGHMLVVPYYSVQNSNNTLLSITNTDTLNGKAVKVRFRGAQNSDDVFDFTVLMSPGDVWTAAVSMAADGKATLTTADKSCTLPANVNQPFVITRVNGADDAAKNAATREGYVEIFNMADIPVAAAPSLYASIKHTAAGVPLDCGHTSVTSLFNDPANGAAAEAAGLHAPTTGLTASWTVINVPAAAAWTGNAAAVEARDVNGLPGYGAIVFHPQAATAVPLATARLRTSDPLLRGGVDLTNLAIGAPGAAALSASMFDFPDFSTPYLVGTLGAQANGIATRQQAFNVTRALAVSSVTNEYVTIPGIAAKTDWIFSMPTRRYNVARNYAALPSGANVYTNLTRSDGDVLIATADNYFTPANIGVQSGVICVTGLSTAGGSSAVVPDNLISGQTVNREEKFSANPSEFVISPGEPAAPLSFCGEVSVLSWNAAGQTSVLGGALTRKDLTITNTEGWARIATPGLAVVNTVGLGGSTRNGLPIIGASVTSLTNNGVAAGVSGNYGQTFPHRATRY